MKRGLLNFKSVTPLQKKDIATQVGIKFKAWKTTLLKEDSLQYMLPLTTTKRKIIDRALRNTDLEQWFDKRMRFLYESFEDDADLGQAGVTVDAFKRDYKIMAYDKLAKYDAKYRIKKEIKEAEKKANDLYVNGFIMWMLGKGTEEELVFTPWKRNKPALELKEVRDYLDAFIDIFYDTWHRLTLLVFRSPQSLNDYWLWYKYIMNIKSWPKDDPTYFLEMREWFDGDPPVMFTQHKRKAPTPTPTPPPGPSFEPKPEEEFEPAPVPVFKEEPELVPEKEPELVFAPGPAPAPAPAPEPAPEEEPELVSEEEFELVFAPAPTGSIYEQLDAAVPVDVEDDPGANVQLQNVEPNAGPQSLPTVAANNPLSEQDLGDLKYYEQRLKELTKQRIILEHQVQTGANEQTKDELDQTLRQIQIYESGIRTINQIKDGTDSAVTASVHVAEEIEEQKSKETEQERAEQERVKRKINEKQLKILSKARILQKKQREKHRKLTEEEPVILAGLPASGEVLPRSRTPLADLKKLLK